MNINALEAAKDAFDHAMGLDNDHHDRQPWETVAPANYRDIAVEPAIKAYLSAITDSKAVADRIRSEVCRVVANVMNWPTPVGAQMLGRDLSEPIDMIVEAVIPIIHEANTKRPSTLRDVIAEELSDTLHCSRDWSAWSYGTMSEEDFHTASEDDEYVDGFTEQVRKVFELDTPEEVDKLPIGSRIIDANFNRVAIKETDTDWMPISQGSYPKSSSSFKYPVRVLQIGDNTQ